MVYLGLICPECGTKLGMTETGDSCTRCNRVFPIKSGIHSLLPDVLTNSSSGEIRSAEDPYCGWRKSEEALNVHKSEFLDFKENVLDKFQFSGRVLEIGAGAGWASAMLKARNQNVTVYTSDIAFAFMELALTYFPMFRGIPDILVVADAQKLPFESGYFDSVFCCSAVHHIPDLAKGLAEIRRVLKNGGTFIAIGEGVANPVMRYLYKRIIDRLGWRRKGIEEYKIQEGLYSLGQWQSFFESVGFKQVSYEPCTDPKYCQSYGSAYHRIYYGIADKLPSFLVLRIGCGAKFVATN